MKTKSNFLVNEKLPDFGRGVFLFRSVIASLKGEAISNYARGLLRHSVPRNDRYALVGEFFVITIGNVLGLGWHQLA
jgi:hypothetical protein